MPGPTLARQLKLYVQNMHDQGILDHHYEHMRSLQNEANPQFVNDVLSMLYRDAPEYIARITALLHSENVDHALVKDVAHQLKGSASRCLGMLERVKREFNTLQECFSNITQMERDVANNEARRRRNARRQT
ncbi:hypothetical protein F3Y22_tig00005406pilonHSYRG00059 [Hibiscus syriacus]|uniref:Histidine-containing phosphotransfer protein n=1 Tax=Hibiscus syriacus TaxID=106335 RepID=A0A6A3CEM8_HIBSY|nr:hypothetical protein F3Y22_tig00005406pilonHSYRG00059 [Hibiscus syriacus]